VTRERDPHCANPEVTVIQFDYHRHTPIFVAGSSKRAGAENHAEDGKPIPNRRTATIRVIETG
jgi:hypothetical protein